MNTSPSFQAYAAYGPYLRVKLSAGKLVPAGATDDDIGTLEQRVLAADDYAAIVPRNAEGSVKVVAAGAFAQYATLYAAADGKVDDSGTQIWGIALQSASGDGSIVEAIRARDAVLGTVDRDGLGQDDAKVYPVKVMDLAVWDAPTTRAVVTTAANDDLAVVYNTFLTAAPTIEAGDLKAAGATTRKIGFQFALPAEYVDGQTITLRINAGMKTTVSDGTAVVDAQVARQAAPTVDLCATAAQSINSLTAADKDFTITPTDCVAGELLDVVISVTVTDTATGTAVIGQIHSIEMLLDVKG